MTLYMTQRAEEISRAVEDSAAELLDKLCEGEPRAVREMAWTMLATSLVFSAGYGDCFILPPLEEC